ncbi:MAG: hypothetical protein R6X02_29370 [Enhygromyxa sp.]
MIGQASRELLEEFLTGGIVVVDRLPDREEIGFRTLIQPDGDVCLSINRLALALPPAEFREQLSRHHRHVQEALVAIEARIRRLSQAAGVVFGLVGGAGGLGAGLQFDLVSLAHSVPPELMLSAAWLVGAVLLGALRGSVLRWGVRRWVLERAPLRGM